MLNSHDSAIGQSFYKIPRFSGRIVGIWPEYKRSWATNLICAFSFFVILVGACGENLYGIANLDNLIRALEAFCPGSTKAVCVLKLSIFVIHHREWLELVDRLRVILYSSRSYEAQKTLVSKSTIANRLSLLLVSSGSITNMAFNIQPLIMGLYRWAYGIPGQLDLPFNIILPAFATTPSVFPLTYLLLTASGACTVFTFSFVDGFFLCSCLYISGIFRVIQMDIRSIFFPLDELEIYTPSENDQIRTQLVRIVERHNVIIDLCTDLTRQFTVIVLMHFLSAAFVLCSTILDIMLNTSSLSGLTYIFYSVAALTQLFLYCFGSNHVSESSLAVAGTLYDIGWYKCDVATRKMILMILRRSQRAKSIEVPFFTPSLPAFSSILSTTGSYIALLKTFL
ncbi:PREDICTED: odorant receptor 22c [Drosophila arizonae]|uniref:Odorant receptor n=1 Tax=Drosophila arizonae TaxID=7263 RepID=A0ABM1NPL3_DROAR|nr:PREDICTED: odorant receptor 22c [Drosophila arizonae]